MRKHRLAAAQEIAETLFEAEEALDLAIARAAELAGKLPIARRDAKLSAVVGQEAFSSAAKVLPALTEARERLVETHAYLDEAKDQIGLRQVSFGTPNGKPPPPSGETKLRVVGKAA